jgi:hypothetical protein
MNDAYLQQSDVPKFRIKKFWDFIAAHKGLLFVIDAIALTGVMSIFAAVNFIDPAKLPDWFSDIFVSGFAFFAVTEGITAIVAVVGFVKSPRKTNKADLAILLISFLGPGAACVGSTMMCTGVAAANPVAALAVACLFIVSFTLVVIKQFMHTKKEDNDSYSGSGEKADKKKEKDGNKEAIKIAICVLSGVGVMGLLMKLVVAISIIKAGSFLFGIVFAMAGLVGLVLVSFAVKGEMLKHQLRQLQCKKQLEKEDDYQILRQGNGVGSPTLQSQQQQTPQVGIDGELAEDLPPDVSNSNNQTQTSPTIPTTFRLSSETE